MYIILTVSITPPFFSSFFSYCYGILNIACKTLCKCDFNLCIKKPSNNLLTVNKRLDEWVTGNRLDMKKLQFPKKEAKTPSKNGLPGSRPSSPEREVVGPSQLSHTFFFKSYFVDQKNVHKLIKDRFFFLLFP